MNLALVFGLGALCGAGGTLILALIGAIATGAVELESQLSLADGLAVLVLVTVAGLLLLGDQRPDLFYPLVSVQMPDGSLVPYEVYHGS